jgi:cysteinyl-tRNA synthetase
MANYWMHNGHLQVEGEKMSKSLGNFVTIHDLLHTDKFGGRSWPGEVLRLALLRTHYRQPIDFTVKALEEAEQVLDKWYGVAAPDADDNINQDFQVAMCDDLNTPLAISRLHAIASETSSTAKTNLKTSAMQLGLLNLRGWEWGELRTKNVDEPIVRRAIELRLAARAAKNWKESDRIRDELAAMGIALKDNKDGTTTWEVKR